MTFKFQKICNTKIDIDADSILSKIEKTIVSQNLSGKILKDDSGIPFWQQYYSNICFARNFYLAFPNECKIITNALNDIKSDLRNTNTSSDILELFLNSTMIPRRVNLMKVPCGLTVAPHIDGNRDLCINIGLKNSNSAITYVSDYQEKDFWSNPTESYQMEDGDVYLLNTKKYHSVKSIVSEDSNLHRYVITYSLVF